ncbi:hypothetical protein TSUD_116220 [Trifolium subterraneum]|uniref:Rad21/Rec8-like protein C-terminal eukaryotic domain-containing protein n=1 Tax=Trifolium subterraneum TaxID=3900 RepID=A0A2Z6N6R0_TRISU|nr:hypothetical protein TSUD_116220 [Trifolium subterraneum]
MFPDLYKKISKLFDASYVPSILISKENTCEGVTKGAVDAEQEGDNAHKFDAEYYNFAEEDRAPTEPFTNPTRDDGASEPCSDIVGTPGNQKAGASQNWKLFDYLKGYCQQNPNPNPPAKEFTLEHLLVGKCRKTAAKSFYNVLVLGANDLVEVKQAEPFGSNDADLTPRCHLRN